VMYMNECIFIIFGFLCKNFLHHPVKVCSGPCAICIYIYKKRNTSVMKRLREWKEREEMNVRRCDEILELSQSF